MLSEHGPCLGGGTVTLDDVLFTTKIPIHIGGDAITPERCVALLDTSSAQSFIRRDESGRMFLVGAVPTACPAALVSGVVLANLPLCGPRPASA